MAIRNQLLSIHISTVSRKEKQKKHKESLLSFLGNPPSPCPLGGHRGRCGVPTVSPPVHVGEEGAASVSNGGQGPEELSG